MTTLRERLARRPLRETAPTRRALEQQLRDLRIKEAFRGLDVNERCVVNVCEGRLRRR